MRNEIRDLLNDNKPTIGTHLSSTWPTLWEVVGSTGQFDYIEFGSQYGAWDLHDFDNVCRAAELTGLGTMIKVDRHPKDWIAQRAIAAGFDAVLFADITSAREAKTCVEAVRLPPVGFNGFVGTRGIRIDDYIKRLDDIVIAVMIEKKSLFDEVEDVLAIEGIEMIQFGPMDYGMSLRTPGQPFNRADLRSKILADRDTVNQMAIDADVRPRAETGSAEGCQYYLERGIRDFCIGWDTDMVRTYCTEHGSKLRNMMQASR
jgi:2-keto-3-deoxy-L-rhamnonate aldolase RhmA